MTMNKWEIQHQRNIQKYMRQLDAIYKEAAEEASAIGVSIDDIDLAKPFVFKDYPQTKKRVNKLLGQFRKNMQAIIVNGIRSEWILANEKNNELCNWVFGDNADNLPLAVRERYYTSNPKAREAFITRKENGLNLSDRVWNYTNQFKTEIELGLDIGIRSGESADEISRDIREYLKEPKKLFRRVRDDNGELQLSKAAQNYHPGRGVYRSSYKNARRLTATETNMAYMAADYERWQKLDFVVGIKIEVSRTNHEEDMCDELAGKYPKDFKFLGWHPHCRCHALTILKSMKEMEADSKRILNREEPSAESENAVKEMPQSFNDWVRKNAVRINRAKTVPYFIKDNSYKLPKDVVIDRVKRKKNPLEIARERHAARTEEQKQAIVDKWNERVKEYNLIKTTANNIIKVAGEYGEVDAAKLNEYLSKHQLYKAREETNSVAKQIVSMKKEEKALSDIIPNAHEWHKQYTIDELKAVKTAVSAKLDTLKGLTLEEQAKKLEFEAVDFLGGNMHNVQSKYATWKVSQDAYFKQLDKVNKKIAINDVKAELKVVSDWLKANTGSKDVDNMLQEAYMSILTNEELASIKKKASDVLGEYNKILAAEAKKYKSEVTFSDKDYTQERKDAAMWAKNTKDADAVLRQKSGEVWQKSTDAERDAIYGYTNSYHNIQEPLRGLHYCGDPDSARIGLERIPLIENMIKKSTYETDIWLQRGDTELALKKFGLSNYATASDAEIKALVGKTGTEGGFWSAGVAKGTGFDSKPIIFNIYAPKGTQAMYCEPFSAFGNGSGRGWDGIAQQASFGSESEILLQRGTTMRITKAEKSGGTWYIDVEVVGQKPLPFPYVGGYPYL